MNFIFTLVKCTIQVPFLLVFYLTLFLTSFSTFLVLVLVRSLVADVNATSKKIEAAKKKNIAIVDEAAVDEMMGI